MANKIYCVPTAKGVHSFYLVYEGKEYYLFSQAYRKGVQKYYGKGVSVNEALDFSKTHGNHAMEKTMDKLPDHIRYIEKEYNLEILRQTKRRGRKAGPSSERRCA